MLILSLIICFIGLVCGLGAKYIMLVKQSSKKICYTAEQNQYNSDLVAHCAKVCYKSDNTNVDYNKMLLKSKHMSVFEHSYITRVFKGEAYSMCRALVLLRNDSKFVSFKETGHLKGSHIVTINTRALLELIQNWNYNDTTEDYYYRIVYNFTEIINDFFPEVVKEFREYCEINVPNLFSITINIDDEIDVLRELSNDENYSAHFTDTFEFTTSRDVTHELVRHRDEIAFSQQSQRYVSYNKHGFMFIYPIFLLDLKSAASEGWVDKLGYYVVYSSFYTYLLFTVLLYKFILWLTGKPEDARSILPNCTATVIAVTATKKEWSHILNLRYYGTTGKPAAQIKDLMCRGVLPYF